MTTLVAVDPGCDDSAFVIFDHGGRVCRFGKQPNHELLVAVRDWSITCPGSHLAIEMIQSFGMPVGREVFETCVWIGRFMQAWQGLNVTRILRQTVKIHLCKSAKAKDGNIRQALIDMYGGKDIAIGNKKKPGQLYGVSADVWQALAVGVTYRDTYGWCPSEAAA